MAADYLVIIGLAAIGSTTCNKNPTRMPFMPCV